MNKTTLAIFAALCASLALAEDFKTINGKEYKNATVSHIEADGIVLKTKSGIVKVYFAELPKDVQKRFGYSEAEAQKAAEEKHIEEQKVTEQLVARTLEDVEAHQVSLENSLVNVQFDFRSHVIRETDPGWFRTVLWGGGSRSASMVALVPKAGMEWFERIPFDGGELSPHYVFARVEKEPDGVYFVRLLGPLMLPDGHFGGW